MFGRLGLLCYRRRRLVVAAWLALVLASLPLVPSIPGLLKPGGFADPTLESQQAQALLAREVGERDSLVAVFQPADLTPADDPAFLAAVDATLAPLAGLTSVERVIPPSLNPRQIAPDRRVAFAIVLLRGDPDSAPRLVPEIRRALASGPLTPVVTGRPVAYADIVAVSEEDLRRAELISIPLALAALVLVFGSLVAAGMPVVVGGLSVVVALGVLAVVARLTDLSVFVLNLATLLGLGLGTDYSLFMTSRFREELRRDGDVGRSVERTVEYAGRAVFFSGLTVFIGLLGLVWFDFMMLRSLGIGGAIVVAVGVLAALTLLPALLGLVGQRIDALTVVRWADAQGAIWSRLATAVMRHPWAVLLPTLALLLALGAPFLSARFSLPDAEVLPEHVESRRGFELLRRHFGEGEFGPIVVALQAPDTILTEARIDAIYDLSRYLASDPSVARVEGLVDLDPRLTREQYRLLYGRGVVRVDPSNRPFLGVSRDDRTVALTVVPRCSVTSAECAELVARIRALRPGAGLTMLVGGLPPAAVDVVDRLYETFPRAVLLVVGTTYLVLLVLFRSVLLPLKAIAMNALSLLASYGALVVVFQEGYGADLLGFRPLGYVEATLPIITFCLLFGLSMDYEVFLLSRIKEAWDHGVGNGRSVAVGLASSGRVITNAAMIVVLVSASFVTADVILVKAVGLGTALAVFIDATIVRALLVPATMRLLGDLNWWAPRPLLRLLPAPRPID
jgi:RND superfamily putative drug exporter